MSNETDGRAMDPPSWRENVDLQLAQLQHGGGPKPTDGVTPENQELILGSLRTFHDRITALETSVASWASAATQLDQKVIALEARIKQLETPTPAPPVG